MLRALLVLFVFALPAKAGEKKVAVTFLGGVKKAPLDGLKVTIRKHTGDWTKDHKAKPLTSGKTEKDGTARFKLAGGYYYVEIASDRELPYLQVPVGHKGNAGNH